MDRRNKRYKAIIGFNSISVIGFFILVHFLKHNIQGIFDSNGAIIGTLSAAWIIFIGIDLYLLLLLIISIVGFLISKHKNITELRIAFKYQSLILFVIWFGFSTFWMIIS